LEPDGQLVEAGAGAPNSRIVQPVNGLRVAGTIIFCLRSWRDGSLIAAALISSDDSKARRRGSGVWESVGGFESQRAIDVGRQVAREVDAQPVERRQRKPASKKDAPRTIGRTIVVGAIETHTIRAALAALPRTPDRIEVVAAGPEQRELEPDRPLAEAAQCPAACRMSF
jgi:hypothetical protein